jgi:hypothetical protein
VLVHGQRCSQRSGGKQTPIDTGWERLRGGPCSLLQKAGVVGDQEAVRIAEVLDHILPRVA